MPNQYYPFRADLWTVNMNFENSACVTSQTDNELTVYGTFRTNSDITGLYFYTKDLINNTQCNYNTIQNYSDIILTFDVEYTGDILHLDDTDVLPALVVYTTDRIHHYIYFNDLHTINPVSNETVPVSDGSPVNLQHRLINPGSVICKLPNGTVLEGVDYFADADYLLNYTEGKFKALTSRTINKTGINIIYSYQGSTTSANETILNTPSYNAVSLRNKNIKTGTVSATTGNNTTLDLGELCDPDVHDYEINYATGKFKALSERTIGANVAIKYEYATNHYVTEYLPVSEDWSPIPLGHGNIVNGSVTVTLPNGTVLEEGVYPENKDYEINYTEGKLIPLSRRGSGNDGQLTIRYTYQTKGTENELITSDGTFINLSHSNIIDGTVICKLTSDSTILQDGIHNVGDYAIDYINGKYIPISNAGAGHNGSITVNYSYNNIYTVSETVPKSDGSFVNLEHSNIILGSVRCTLSDGTPLYSTQTYVAQDYKIDYNQGTFTALSPRATGVSDIQITYQYKSVNSYQIKFNNLHDSNGGSIDPTKIEYIQIPLFPVGYKDGTYIITENKNYSFKMKNITVQGSRLNTEKEPFTDNNYRLCEGYDDCYYLSPRRLAHEMYKLGYTTWNDLYIGASHFYEKTGTIGANARPVHEEKVDYSKMTASKTVGINYAFRKWLEDYIKWFKYYDTENIIISVSCECLQMPEAWRQVLSDGNYAKTGWTPATYFYAPTNQEARNFVELVSRQCLNIEVAQDVKPILQWGEPWWWWQELYPESISIDPDHQETNPEKYPGQPPAFYDDSTKAKYLEETGEELPVYATSSDEYDREVINWLKDQLVDYSNFMKNIVKSYSDGLYTVLYFPPSIVDVARVPPMMREVNFPAEAWNDGQLDFIQIEDYDWVITDNKAHEQIYDFAKSKFGISYKDTHYFGGYVQYPKNATREWALIITAMEEAVKRGIGQVYVWAGTQVRRDNIQLHDPTFTPVPVYPDPVLPDKHLLNVIVLDEFENVIAWLNPDLVNITETNKEETCRKISIEYPLNKAPVKGTKDWYMQGNKIFVPSTLGIDNCLYVINSDYELDYWKENTVSFEAEEVLTELNYEYIPLFTESIKVTKDKLTSWFGSYYTIKNVDKLDTGKTTVSPNGVVSLMNLLRLIEEKTERVFITEYEIQDDKIKRYLSLKDEKNIRKVANTEVLDLNFNLENLSFTSDESSTYSAMAPLLSSNSTNTPDISTASGDSRTSITANTQTDTKKIYERWLNLDVQAGEYIPMICEKESDGTVKYTDYWYAPFDKKKGELIITVPYETDSNYNYIKPPNASPKPKTGSVSTSETNAYAIYNVLANSLLDKLNPELELDISVKDIQKIMKTKNQGYNLYETLYVRAPRFNYYVPCIITETKKDPHRPGNNTIKVKSDVKSLHNKKETNITTNNKIVETTDPHARIGGILSTTEGNLENKLVSVSIRLNTHDTEEKPAVKETTTDLNPIGKYIYVTKNDLIQMFKTIENHMTNQDQTVQSYYIVTAITGERQKINKIWYETLFYTYKTNLMKNSFIIHYYPNYKTRFTSTDIEYKFCYYYDYFTSISGEYEALTITNGVLSKAFNI